MSRWRANLCTSGSGGGGSWPGGGQIPSYCVLWHWGVAQIRRRHLIVARATVIVKSTVRDDPNHSKCREMKRKRDKEEGERRDEKWKLPAAEKHTQCCLR